MIEMQGWQQDREERRRKALEQHERLHRLFKEDRFAFERWRRQAIEEVINSAPDPELRAKLWKQQEDWERRMKNAGTPQNRLVLAKTFFWAHFFEKWMPAIEEFQQTLSPAKE